MNFNKKGFTLIELLAVIVILGVLLALAVPSVTKYINTSKKSTYIDNVQSYARTAKQQATIGTYKYPVNNGDATVIYFSDLIDHLDTGGKTSSYGYEFNEEYSFVVITNEGSAENPDYEVYVAAMDKGGYGIGIVSDGNKINPFAIAYDDLKTSNIVQITSKIGATANITTESDGTISGSVQVAKYEKNDKNEEELKNPTYTVKNVYK